MPGRSEIISFFCNELGATLVHEEGNLCGFMLAKSAVIVVDVELRVTSKTVRFGCHCSTQIGDLTPDGRYASDQLVIDDHRRIGIKCFEKTTGAEQHE